MTLFKLLVSSAVVLVLTVLWMFIGQPQWVSNLVFRVTVWGTPPEMEEQ